MNRLWIALAAILGVWNASAQLRNAAIDDPGVLKTAKKVAVFVELGPPAPAPYQPDFARAKKQITEKLSKNKLQLVSDAADADIVLVASEFNRKQGIVGSATTVGQTTTAVAQDRICLGDEVKVFTGGKMPSEKDTPIWSSLEICGYSWPLNRAMDKLAKAMKK
jgi:hypothetical protein